MKTIYLLALLCSATLIADPMGSLHDAWSDWIIENHLRVETEQYELSDNDNFEPDQEEAPEYN